MTWLLKSGKSLHRKRKMESKIKNTGSCLHLLPCHPILLSHSISSLPSPMRFLLKHLRWHTFIFKYLLKWSKYLKDYVLKSEPPICPKDIITPAWLIFFFSCGLYQKISNKVYPWTPFLHTVYKDWITNYALIYKYRYQFMECFFLEYKQNIFKWKKRWRERKSMWSLKDCSFFLFNHCLSLKSTMEYRAKEDYPKYRLSFVKEI